MNGRGAMTKTKPVAPIDMWIMLIATVRYSLGRRSYMPSLSGELVARYSSYLTRDQLLQIASEIENELNLYSRLGKTLGDPCDEETWRNNVILIRWLVDV